jgi:hypothetical protein
MYDFTKEPYDMELVWFKLNKRGSKKSLFFMWKQDKIIENYS